MKSSRILAEDYTVLLHIPRNPVFHECTKYINCHEVRMKIVDGFLKTMYFRTCDQLVNALTKALDPSSFQESSGSSCKSIWLNRSLKISQAPTSRNRRSDYGGKGIYVHKLGAPNIFSLEDHFVSYIYI